MGVTGPRQDHKDTWRSWGTSLRVVLHAAAREEQEMVCGGVVALQRVLLDKVMDERRLRYLPALLPSCRRRSVGKWIVPCWLHLHHADTLLRASRLDSCVCV